jgi:hypothetical protein
MQGLKALQSILTILDELRQHLGVKRKGHPVSFRCTRFVAGRFIDFGSGMMGRHMLRIVLDDLPVIRQGVIKGSLVPISIPSQLNQRVLEARRDFCRHELWVLSRLVLHDVPADVSNKLPPRMGSISLIRVGRSNRVCHVSFRRIGGLKF